MNERIGPMNEQNVAALERILNDIRIAARAYAKIHGMDEPLTMDDHQFAECLAARGVLVPAVLTDAEIDSVPTHDHEYFGDNTKAQWEENAETRRLFRATLENIARGDPGVSPQKER